MATTKHVVKIVSATEAKNRFGEILKAAYLHAEHLIIERDGVPVAAIVPIADYQEIFALDETGSAEATGEDQRRRQARLSLAEFLKQVHSQPPDMSEDEAEADIAEAVQATRSSQ